MVTVEARIITVDTDKGGNLGAHDLTCNCSLFTVGHGSTARSHKKAKESKGDQLRAKERKAEKQSKAE